jgi:hypothetical protein
VFHKILPFLKNKKDGAEHHQKSDEIIPFQFFLEINHRKSAKDKRRFSCKNKKPRKRAGSQGAIRFRLTGVSPQSLTGFSMFFVNDSRRSFRRKTIFWAKTSWLIFLPLFSFSPWD